MKDLEDHPGTLSTQKQYLCKGLDNSIAQDQVEKEYHPSENTVHHISG
jgi:hypothetical protein